MKNNKKSVLVTAIKKHCQTLTLMACLPLMSMQGVAQDNNFIEAQKVGNEYAEFEDADILAKELGVDYKEVKNALEFQENFEKYFTEINKNYPNKVARVWLEPAPSQQAYIQFVGDVPERIKSGLNIDISGGGLYSFDEQNSRVEYLNKVLTENKHNNHMTYFDHQTGLIVLEMKTENRSTAMSYADLDQLLANDNKLDADEKALAYNLSANDIDLVITEGQGEIYDMEMVVRGGEWVTRNGVNNCTSGWSVSGPNGNGIVTAAHCTGLNGLNHHYTNNDPRMTWRDQERGRGDVEYHTTTEPEVAQYYASENQVRNVARIRTTASMRVGNRVCEYGRSSNTRTCNHTVTSNNVTVTFSDGVTVRNLVRVTVDESIGGDSGGPWSWGTTAWGVHSGSNGSTSLFTPVQRAQTELNIRILTQ